MRSQSLNSALALAALSVPAAQEQPLARLIATTINGWTWARVESTGYVSTLNIEAARSVLEQDEGDLTAKAMAAVVVEAYERGKRDMEVRKDAAYLERNRCVALLARMALAMGFSAGTARTAIEGWHEEWHGCVYIDLPSGQVSWHYHDGHAHLFEDLPGYIGKWDGHDTDEKYRRVDIAGRSGCPLPQTNELRHEMAIEQEGAFLFMTAMVHKLGGKVKLKPNDMEAAAKLDMARAELPEGGFSIKLVPALNPPDKPLLEPHVPTIAQMQ